MCLIVLVIVAAAVPLVRARAREVIAARCAAAVGGACEVGEVRLAREGVLAGHIRMAALEGGVSVNVGAVAVEWSWWKLLWSSPQAVNVRVSGVAVEARRPVDQLAGEWRRLHARRRRGRGEGALRVGRLSIENAGGVATLGGAMVARMEGASMYWDGARGVEVRWRSARVGDQAGLALDSGACSVVRLPAASRVTVDCEGFASRVDLEGVDERVRALGVVGDGIRAAVQEQGSGAAEAGAAAAGGGEAPASAAASVVAEREGAADGAALARLDLVLRARGGAIALSRAGQPVLALRPALIQVEGRAGRFDRARVRLGQEGSGPAVEAEWARGAGDRWRLDLNADAVPLPELARWLPGVPWHGIEHGRARIRLRAEPSDAPGVVSSDGELVLEEFGLAHSGLAHDPIDGLAVSLRGAVRVDLRRRRIESEGIQVALNGVSVGVAGWVERAGGRLALDARIRLPTTACDAIRRALPPVVVGPLVDLRFAGTLGADVHLAVDTTNLAATELEVQVDDACAIAHDGLALGIRRLGGPFVQRVQEPQGVRAFVTGPGSAAWVPLGDVSPFVVSAVLSREDGRFYRHHGFDVGEIRGAIVRNLSAGRFAYGASTLSMQLAKNIFLAREKTLVRKLQEVVFTWYLERHLDKDSILELYLNVVEFGPGIYGVGPAARFFFGREPRDLTPLQAIYLATLLPNPVARFANYQRGGVGEETLARLRAHARSMAARGLLGPAEAAFAQSEVLVFRPPSTPVRGALTQTVEPTTTDAMAAAMAPAVAPSAEDDGEPAREDEGEEEPRSIRPVSVRVGGTL